MSGLRDVPMHAAHGAAPAVGVERALWVLAEVFRWIAWTADADLPPALHICARTLREAEAELLAAASHFECTAERLDSP